MPAFEQDMIFGVDETSQGHVATQERNAPQAWDHLSTGSPTATGNPIENSVTTPIDKAMPVHARATNRLRVGASPLLGSIAGNPSTGPFKVVDRQKGRRVVKLKCPIANTKGCYISHSPDDLVSTIIQGWFIEPGSQLDLETESAVWCIGITGQAAADVIQYAVMLDVADSAEFGEA